MPAIKIGIQLASLRVPFKQGLQIASQLGARGVEIDVRNELRPRELSGTGRRQLRKMLDDLRLEVTAVRFPTRRGYNVADELEQRVAATKEAMDFAFQLGTSIVVNAVGRIPEEATGAEWDSLVAALSDIGHYGQRCGARLAAETGSESAETMLQLLQRLPEGYLNVNFDPGNMIVNGFSASDAVSLLAPYIVHVHAKDGVRDLAQGRGIEVQLGRGSVDFETIVATLEQAGYRGYYTIERNASDARRIIDEMSSAISYLRQL